MPKKREKKQDAYTFLEPTRVSEPVFSVVSKIAQEFDRPYFSAYETRFLFRKDDCYHEVAVGERSVRFTCWLRGARLFLQKDKLIEFCNRLQEQSKRVDIPIDMEIDLLDSKKNIFAVFPRLKMATMQIGGSGVDRGKSAAKFAGSAHKLLMKTREIVDEFRGYDKSFDALENLWEKTKSATDKVKKGRLLEDVLSLLIAQDENFDVVEKNVRTKSEEIDIVLENLGRTVFFSQLGSPLILLECKNWTSKIGAKEVRDFAQKIQNRPRVLVRIGVLVTVSKLTKGANEELVGYRGKDFLIAVLTGEDIENMISKRSRIGEVLKSRIRNGGFR